MGLVGRVRALRLSKGVKELRAKGGLSPLDFLVPAYRGVAVRTMRGGPYDAFSSRKPPYAHVEETRDARAKSETEEPEYAVVVKIHCLFT